MAEASAALIREAERAQVATAGVVAARSARDARQSGLAQACGHRTVAASAGIDPPPPRFRPTA